MRVAFEDRKLKIAVFAACGADELAFGRSFCRLLCGLAPPEERHEILQNQQPCFVHTSLYPQAGGLVNINRL